MSMKRVLAVVVMLLMTSAVWAQGGKKATPAASPKTGGVEAMLLDIENKWVEAGKKQNPAILDPYLAEGFMSMQADGTYMNRADYLAGVKKSKWEISTISNLKTYVTGDHAIVTGDWRGKGTGADGKPVDTTEHWIDTFVLTNGKWKCTADASTTAKK